MKTVRCIGVLGTGTMARGITRLAIESGLKVAVWGRSRPSLDKFAVYIAEKTGVAQSLSGQELVEKDNNNLACGSTLDILSSADLIVEAILESLPLKQDIITALEKVISEDVVIATTTSSLRVEDVMRYASSPERTIGLHFMNPAYRIPLVEVVPTPATAEAVLDTTLEFCKTLKRTPIVVSDTRGFVLNRVLFPLIAEAIIIHAEGQVDTTDIDNILKLGAHHPMGPLELADFIGLDVCLAIMENLATDLLGPYERSILILRRMIELGHLGRKSGRGFHLYKQEAL